jgi:hypothetical protein
MRTIKYRFKVSGTGFNVGVLKDCYGSSWEYLSSLVAILKKDYPDLKDSNIEVIRYGPPKHSRMFGAEAYVENPTKEYEDYPLEWLMP